MVDEHIRHLKGVLEWGGGSFIQEVGETGYRFACPHTNPVGVGARARVTTN